MSAGTSIRGPTTAASASPEAMPNVPTFEESGVPGVDADSYWGVYAPAGTPPAALAAEGASLASGSMIEFSLAQIIAGRPARA